MKICAMAGWAAAAAGMLGALGAHVGQAAGQVVELNLATPAIDRWMYSFNQTPGTESEARVFSPLFSPFQSSFDNRDGQFLVGFDTAPTVTSGLATSNYRILSAKVTARISRNRVFQFDPTYDAFNTYLPSDPAYVPDSDAGKALEMFVCGYRNGFTAATFTQTSPHSPGPSFPSRSVRNVYPAVFNADGTLRDVSNNVEDRFNVRPIAVGAAVSNADQKDAAGGDAPFTPVNPGDLVPLNTDIEFAIDTTNPDALKGLREGLAGGRLNVMITSLSITNQQATNVPAFYTRRYFTDVLPDPAAKPASLRLRVCVGAPGDWNCSGSKTVQDVFDFLSDWFDGRGDFNADGVTTVQDIFDFLGAWFS